MPTSTITSKGQTTIPKAVREHLGLKPGNRIDCVIGEDGQVVIRPSTYDIRDLEGVLHRAGGAHMSVEEMNRVVRERHASRAGELTASTRTSWSAIWYGMTRLRPPSPPG